MTHPGRFIALLAVCSATLFMAACEKPTAFGEPNSLILVTSGEDLWFDVRQETFETLEPRTFTVRPEKKFFVEPVDTAHAEEFASLRTFRQLIFFGTPDNRFIQQVADRADEDANPYSIVQARDIWARGQRVTAVVLDPERPEESWTEQLPDLIDLIDRQYRDLIRQRMFASGVDTARANTLKEQFGFGVRFPRVYRVRLAGEDNGAPVILRNDNPDPSELIRSVTVDWAGPMEELTAERAYEWRSELAAVHYVVPQETDGTRGQVRELEVDGRPALEASGTWRDVDTGFPAAGPFLVRLVQCPDRTYLLDGWIYAPGKDKYQYMIQVREIMDSFSCS